MNKVLKSLKSSESLWEWNGTAVNQSYQKCFPPHSSENCWISLFSSCKHVAGRSQVYSVLLTRQRSLRRSQYKVFPVLYPAVGTVEKNQVLLTEAVPGLCIFKSPHCCSLFYPLYPLLETRAFIRMGILMCISLVLKYSCEKLNWGS